MLTVTSQSDKSYLALTVHGDAEGGNVMLQPWIAFCHSGRLQNIEFQQRIIDAVRQLQPRESAEYFLCILADHWLKSLNASRLLDAFCYQWASVQYVHYTWDQTCEDLRYDWICFQLGWLPKTAYEEILRAFSSRNTDQILEPKYKPILMGLLHPDRHVRIQTILEEIDRIRDTKEQIEFEDRFVKTVEDFFPFEDQFWKDRIGNN